MKKNGYMNLFVPFIHERSHPEEKSGHGAMDRTPKNTMGGK